MSYLPQSESHANRTIAGSPIRVTNPPPNKTKSLNRNKGLSALGPHCFTGESWFYIVLNDCMHFISFFSLNLMGSAIRRSIQPSFCSSGHGHTCNELISTTTATVKAQNFKRQGTLKRILNTCPIVYFLFVQRKTKSAVCGTWHICWESDCHAPPNFVENWSASVCIHTGLLSAVRADLFLPSTPATLSYTTPHFREPLVMLDRKSVV